MRIFFRYAANAEDLPRPELQFLPGPTAPPSPSNFTPPR